MIIRNPSRQRFTVLDNSLFEFGLKLEDLGLVAYLLSKPDGWKINKTHLQNEFGIGRDKLKSILGRLRESGHIELTRNQDESGQIQGSYYVLHESPTEGLKNRLPVKPSAGKPDPLVNTELLTNTEINNKRARKVCPDDWMPSPEQVAKLKDKHPRLNITEAIEEMKNHEFKTAKSRWDLALNNWCSRKAKWSKDDERIQQSKPLTAYDRQVERIRDKYGIAADGHDVCPPSSDIRSGVCNSER